MADNFVCFHTETEGEINCNGTIYYLEGGEGGSIKPSQALFWVYLVVYIFLVLFAGEGIQLLVVFIMLLMSVGRF